MPTIITGAQKDWNTDKWYFIIWSDQQRKRVKHKSEPIYEEEDDAHAAAAEWVQRNPPTSSNFSWGKPARRPAKRR